MAVNKFKSVCQKSHRALARGWFTFDVLIDDAVHNVINAPYQSILLSQPWNESFDVSSDEHIYRANDWLEVEDIISKIV